MDVKTVYINQNVSTKVVKLIQRYTEVVNNIVWRKKQNEHQK